METATDIQVIESHGITIRYLGPTNTKPSRLVVTWQDWPSNGGKVRKYLPYSFDRRETAKHVANLFCDWLNAGNVKTRLPKVKPDSIHLAYMHNGDFALMVNTAYV